RDDLMIAHSFKGDVFGPAQRLHGATYVIDVEFKRTALGENDIVVDIGRESDVLREILAELNYRNLDEVPEFASRNTTTEFLARVVFDRMAARIAAGALGPSARAMHSLRVTLHESHIAWAAFEATLVGAEGETVPAAVRRDA